MTQGSRDNTGSLTAAEVQRPLLDAEAERELAKVINDDPDLVMLSDYMAGALSPAQARLFERRLVSDAALASWAIPLLRARDLIVDERQRAMDESAGASARTWEQLQRRMLLDSLEPPRDAGPAPHAGNRAPAARPGWVARFGARIVLWTLAGSAAITLIGFAMPYVFVYASGVASQVASGWDVTRTYASGGTQVRLPNGGVVAGLGPTFVAVRKQRWLDPKGWGDRRFDVYAHARHLTVGSMASLGVETRVDGPLAVVTSADARYHVDEEDEACAVRVSVQFGQVMVAPAANPSNTLPLGPGEMVRITCDGLMTRGEPPVGGGR